MVEEGSLHEKTFQQISDTMALNGALHEGEGAFFELLLFIDLGNLEIEQLDFLIQIFDEALVVEEVLQLLYLPVNGQFIQIAFEFADRTQKLVALKLLILLQRGEDLADAAHQVLLSLQSFVQFFFHVQVFIHNFLELFSEFRDSLDGNVVFPEQFQTVFVFVGQKGTQVLRELLEFGVAFGADQLDQGVCRRKVLLLILEVLNELKRVQNELLVFEVGFGIGADFMIVGVLGRLEVLNEKVNELVAVQQILLDLD